MKIGFITSAFSSWGGGVDFLSNIVQSMSVCNKNDELYIFLPKETKKQLIKRFLSNVIVIKKWIKYRGISRQELFLNLGNYENVNVVYTTDGLDNQLSIAEKYGMDIVMPCFSPPKDYNSPWIGYIYDCQHKYYPENFSSAEIKSRDTDFQLMLDKATDIIVNANNVKVDLMKFYKVTNTNIHVLPFSPFPRMEWFSLESIDLERYDVNNEYFIICNQFWKHKGHLFAFEAFAKYVSLGGKYDLLCTGKLQDHTGSIEYPEKIVNTIKKLKLQDRIKLVGYVSKVEQIKLLKEAKALLQPTLFEGGPGGGAAYNAISLGIPVIASDIPVNLEMESELVRFFDYKKEESLVKALLESESNESNVNEKDLIKKGINNQHRLSEKINLVINEALKNTT